MQITQLMPKLLAVVILSTFLTNARAAEALLCDVTSDIDNEVAKMVYELDEVTGAIKHLFKDRFVNGKRIERQELFAKDLLGDGIVLAKKDKTIAVRMYSHNFDEESGGVLYLDTLYNGVKGERREYEFDLAKAPSGLVMVYKGLEFKKMHFIAKRSRLLGIIGIEKVNFLK